MGSVIAVMSIVGLLVLFAYLKFPPPYANPKTVKVFDMMVLGVCALLCLAFILNMRSNLIDSPDERWWQPMAIAGALGIEAVFLGICFLLRNFWVFRPPSRGSGFR